MKLVLVGEQRYPLVAFEAAFNQAALDHVARRTETKGTPRQLMRAVAAMKSRTAHKIILRDALERLTKLEPVSMQGDIHAKFPTPDKV